MTDSHDIAAQVEAALTDVDDLQTAEELAIYEQVLTQLTELLDALDEHAPGGA